MEWFDPYCSLSSQVRYSASTTDRPALPQLRCARLAVQPQQQSCASPWPNRATSYCLAGCRASRLPHSPSPYRSIPRQIQMPFSSDPSCCYLTGRWASVRAPAQPVLTCDNQVPLQLPPPRLGCSPAPSPWLPPTAVGIFPCQTPDLPPLPDTFTRPTTSCPWRLASKLCSKKGKRKRKQKKKRKIRLCSFFFYFILFFLMELFLNASLIFQQELAPQIRDWQSDFHAWNPTRNLLQKSTIRSHTRDSIRDLILKIAQPDLMRKIRFANFWISILSCLICCHGVWVNFIFVKKKIQRKLIRIKFVLEYS